MRHAVDVVVEQSRFFSRDGESYVAVRTTHRKDVSDQVICDGAAHGVSVFFSVSFSSSGRARVLRQKLPLNVSITAYVHIGPSIVPAVRTEHFLPARA